MEEKIIKVKEEVADKLDLPREIVLDIPKLTIIGNKEITIENHKGILAFQESLIKVNSSLGVIELQGKDFEITFIGGNTLCLRGSFSNIVYEEKR